MILNHTFTLIRHGESQSNVNLKVLETTPDPLIQLTPTGMKQARDLGNLLGSTELPPHIWTSPFKRAIQTTEQIIAGLADQQVEVSYKINPLVFERSYGALETDRHLFCDSQPAADKHQNLYDSSGLHFFSKPGGGESGPDVMLRMNAAFRQIALHDSQLGLTSSVIVTHHYAMTCAMVLTGNLSPFEADDYDIPNCGMVVINTTV